MNQQELLTHAKQLAGLSIKELALMLSEPLPQSNIQGKGWLGQIVEKYLGATAGNAALPDFVDLGIELKTIPILPNGQPKESTYICTAPIPITDGSWNESRVWKKMHKILWVPYLYQENLSFGERIIGMPILWSPSKEIIKILQRDWEELVEKLNLGKFSELTAHLGEYLQIRPKALNSDMQIKVMDENGEWLTTTPKGFYVRTALTKRIIQENYIFL